MLVIQHKFPEFKPVNRQFKFLNTIDVDNAFCYLEKGVVRSIAAGFKSLFKLDFDDFKQRIRVLTGRERDPYDTFDYLLNLQKKYGFTSIYFFLLADYGYNDKNIPVSSKKFQILIKSLADYVQVGIHPSWGSNTSYAKLSKEIQRLPLAVLEKTKEIDENDAKVAKPKLGQLKVKWNPFCIDISTNFSKT